MSVSLAAAVSIVTGFAVAGLVRLLVPPTRRLAPRVRPYAIGSRTSLGRSADVGVVADPGGPLTASTLRRLFGPPVTAAVRRLTRVWGGTSDERLLLRLRQADCLQDVPERLRVQEYRVRQFGNAVAGSLVAVAGGLAVGASAAPVLALAVLGTVAGASRWRARVDRAIEERRTRMSIELYTVNQLLAMHVRVGGGVIHAVRRVVARGRGAVVDELSEALRAHTSGVRASDAFVRIAQTTPDPDAARTYKLLAAGAEYGADLAGALLDLSEGVRDARREALRRTATRRRAAMLVPIIAILAPVMLLFIAAPLPSLVFGNL